MPITCISINGLFGTTSASIKIKNNDKITIIHAPNGFGKTTIFKLIDIVFKGNYESLRTVPFESIAIDWADDIDNGTIKETFKIEKVGGPNSKIIQTSLWRNDDIVGQAMVKGPRDEEKKNELIGERRILLSKIKNNKGADQKQSLLDKLRNVNLEIFINGYTIESNEDEQVDFFEWIRPGSVKLIEAQRLIVRQGEKKSQFFEAPELNVHPMNSEYAVHLNSRELQTQIETAKVQYASASQEIDKTFPTRLLQAFKRGEEVDAKDVLERSKALTEKRLALAKYGLLDHDSSVDEKLAITESDINDKFLRIVLDLFIQDANQKMSTFDDLYGRINLLVTIINDKFSNKQIGVSDKNGFTIVFSGRANTIPIDISSLSSGEQHQLVMNYELIFKTKLGSLVLIDEPEISQDVVWQKQLLGDFKRMAELGDFNIILATHSPLVVDDRWDLLTELKV